MEKSALRIAFTGPESSGKTTLSDWFSKYYQIPVVEEYARFYLEKSPNYSQSDLDYMATTQAELWPTGALVADTEMHVFQIWSLEKYAEVSAVIQNLLELQSFDHYFLCAPDIPWEYDPLRENPHDRARLFEIYAKELAAFGRPYTILRGSQEMRQELIKIKVLSLLNA